VVTFTAEAIYQPPPGRAVGGAPAWGPPAATREYAAYTSTFDAPDERQRLLLAATHGAVDHAAVGWPVSFPGAPLDPEYARGRLTDGLTGAQQPYDARWAAFAPGRDAAAVLELPPRAPWPWRSVAAHFLAVPPLWFEGGSHAQPRARNVTTWLPPEVRWAVAPHAQGPWTELGAVSAQWWEREVFDTRSELFELNVSAVTRQLPRPRYLRCSATSAPPPWWAQWVQTMVAPSKGLTVGRLMLDELIVN
jgi:hypothetical protein